MSEIKNVDQPEPTAHEYFDPEGDDPTEIPDPMPEDLQQNPQREHKNMEGDAPTG